MSQSILERNVFEAFDKANSLNAIKPNLNDLDNDFEYLFQTSSLSVHDVSWERTNNLPANINKASSWEIHQLTIYLSSMIF